MKRRSFLQAAVAAALPSSRQAFVNTTGNLLAGGVGLGVDTQSIPVLQGRVSGPGSGESVVPSRPQMNYHEALQQLLLNDEDRAHYESQLFEENAVVSFIDHDIWSKKSWSGSAKITFQRQRNVQRRMDAGVNPFSNNKSWVLARLEKLMFGE